MSFITTIRNFAQLPVRKRTLYVIDVDETVLYFREIARTFWDDEHPKDQALIKWRELVQSSEPVPTDSFFLPIFLERITDEESGILFLTARDFDLSALTETHLSKVGVHVPHDLVCTSGDPKGRLLLWMWRYKYSYRFDHVVFIDDLLSNIEDVQRELPDASVFLFNRLLH
jgi:hypothetical protein